MLLVTKLGTRMYKRVRRLFFSMFFQRTSKNKSTHCPNLSHSKSKLFQAAEFPPVVFNGQSASCLRAADTLRGQCAQSDMTDPNQIASVDLAAAHQNACHTAPHYGQKHPKAKKFSEMSPRSKNLLLVSFAILLLS